MTLIKPSPLLPAEKCFAVRNYFSELYITFRRAWKVGLFFALFPSPTLTMSPRLVLRITRGFGTHISSQLAVPTNLWATSVWPSWTGLCSHQRHSFVRNLKRQMILNCFRSCGAIDWRSILWQIFQRRFQCKRSSIAGCERRNKGSWVNTFGQISTFASTSALSITFVSRRRICQQVHWWYLRFYFRFCDSVICDTIALRKNWLSNSFSGAQWQAMVLWLMASG